MAPGLATLIGRTRVNLSCLRVAARDQCRKQTMEGTMIGNILVGLVALIHCYIVYLEMVLWDTPSGHKAFRMTPEFASASKVLAANQGLYNGFLAAGMVWGLHLGAGGFQFKMFFLLCVAIAGLYGAATVGRKILFIQTVPAVLAIIALWLGW
jgi:putative membrane protein